MPSPARRYSASSSPLSCCRWAHGSPPGPCDLSPPGPRGTSPPAVPSTALALIVGVVGGIYGIGGGSAGIAWTAVTAAVMLALAPGKSRTGAELGNPAPRPGGPGTLTDATLAVAL